MLVKGNEVKIVRQVFPRISEPQLWSPESPQQYKAVTTVMADGKVMDKYETTFGLRWFDWTADKGFFLNGEHYYLLGANVHQDQAGWGDAVTNAAMRRDVQMIKDAGAKAGIAINPGTSFETVKDLLHLCDYVMLMSVNPGFAGQKYLDFVTPKFKKFVDEAKNYGGYDVMIDGACSPEKIEMLSKMGVKGFILGTSALFGKDKSYQEIINELRGL